METIIVCNTMMNEREAVGNEVTWETKFGAESFR
jgi:hypothetical protein